MIHFFNEKPSQSDPIFLAPHLTRKAIIAYRQVFTLERQNKCLKNQNSTLENDINVLKVVHQKIAEIEAARDKLRS